MPQIMQVNITKKKKSEKEQNNPKASSKQGIIKETQETMN